MDIAFFKNLYEGENFIYNSFKQRIVYLLYSYFFSYVFIIVSGLLIIKPIDFFITSFLGFDSILIEFNKSSQNILSLNYINIILVYPFFEELLFRLSLKPKIIHFYISFSIMLFFLFGGKLIFTSDFFPSYKYQLFLSVFSTILILQIWKDKILIYSKANIKYFVMISIILFGLVHIQNIKIYNINLILFYPVFVIPQIIIGYFVTNLRLKYNFFWGLALHALVNSTFVIISL